MRLSARDLALEISLSSGFGAMGKGLMLCVKQLAIDGCVRRLKKAYRQGYGDLEKRYADVAAWAARLALENIANSDALYHDMDHTIMVTLAAQEILRGKHLAEGGVTPWDWIHFMVAALCHDIGYVKGACRQDRSPVFATGVGDKTVELSPDGTDVALTPYHVDRGQLFVRERFGGKLLVEVDVETICAYIEMTRFPVPPGEKYQDTRGLGGLLRAADFIGQLGDPNYLTKIPALYYEFSETGVLARIGYKSPGEMRRQYGQFYWNVVWPYIKDAVRLLGITQEGKQWIANLHAHVFHVEHSEA